MNQFVRRFSDDQILEILTSAESDNAVSRRFSCSRATIGQIRTGKTYKGVHPDVARRLQKSCLRCCNWKNQSCLFEFPDPIQEGPRAANYCSNYQL